LSRPPRGEGSTHFLTHGNLFKAIIELMNCISIFRMNKGGEPASLVDHLLGAMPVEQGSGLIAHARGKPGLHLAWGGKPGENYNRSIVHLRILGPRLIVFNPQAKNCKKVAAFLSSNLRGTYNNGLYRAPDTDKYL
jgi:hypothetical protein